MNEFGSLVHLISLFFFPSTSCSVGLEFLGLEF